jgi:hypothetical protein
MPLYPDLAASGIAFMQFAFHVGGGLNEIDAFWRDRGVDLSARRLLFAGYSRKGVPHSVWLQWVRSHDECADVHLGFDARRPSQAWPGLSGKEHRLRESDLREFLQTVAKGEGLGRVRARYGFPWDKTLDSIMGLPPQFRPVSLTLEALDEDEQLAMTVTYERFGESWFAIIAPSGTFTIKDEPVSDTFFKAPYETARLLAKSLQRSEEV